MSKKKLILAFVVVAGLIGVVGSPSVAAASCATLGGGVFECSGSPVAMGRDANVLPDVRVAFTGGGEMLYVTLIYDGATSFSSGLPTSLTFPTQLLTGVLFDVTNPDLVLTALAAHIATGSALTETIAVPGDEISGHWADKGRRFGRRGGIVGSILTGSLGDGDFDYVVSATGDINATGLEADEDNHTLGRRDVIDRSLALVKGPQPGGADFSIAPPAGYVDLDQSDFVGKGPLVQNSVILTYLVEGGQLQIGDIDNVVALFGTEGLATEDCY